MGQRGSARARHPQYLHEVAFAVALDRDIYGDGIANAIRYEQAERGTGRLSSAVTSTFASICASMRFDDGNIMSSN